MLYLVSLKYINSIKDATDIEIAKRLVRCNEDIKIIQADTICEAWAYYCKLLHIDKPIDLVLRIQSVTERHYKPIEPNGGIYWQNLDRYTRFSICYHRYSYKGV